MTEITRTFVPPQQREDLYAWFQRMREECPVYYEPEVDVWHVFRHQDVEYVLSKYNLFETYPRSVGIDEFDPLIRMMMFCMDPPQHRNYRHPIYQCFTSRIVPSLAEKIQAIAQTQIDRFRSKGEMDFASDFAYPLHEAIAAESLDFPHERRLDLIRWSDVLTLNDFTTPIETRLSAIREIKNFFMNELLPRRRHELGNDLLSEMLRMEVEGHALSDQEVTAFFLAITIGSHETTPNLLCHTIYLCNDYPDLLQQFKQGPAIVKSAIEEILRFRSPFWGLQRKAKTDVVVAGQQIPRNSMIFCWIAAANRDPEQFVNPEHFDIQRTPNPHLTFGHGIHLCFGTHLARMEAAIVLPMLAEQLPDIHCNPDLPPEYLPNQRIYGFHSLPVVFTPAG